MTNRVHAAVDRAKAPELQSMRNPAAFEPELHQLGPGDHSVLALSKRPDRPVQLTLVPLCMNVMHKGSRVDFSPAG
jgi:hypothetical protein